MQRLCVRRSALSRHVIINWVGLVLLYGLSSAASAADHNPLRIAQVWIPPYAMLHAEVSSPERHPVSDPDGSLQALHRPEQLDPDIVAELEPSDRQDALWQQAKGLVLILCLLSFGGLLVRVLLMILNRRRRKPSFSRQYPQTFIPPAVIPPSPMARTTMPVPDDAATLLASAVADAQLTAPEPVSPAVAVTAEMSLETAEALLRGDTVEATSPVAAVPDAQDGSAVVAPPAPPVTPQPRQMGAATPTTLLSETWQLFATSQQGQGHLTKSPAIPCQDSHALRVIDAGWGVAVVCDGAGSQAYSQLGAAFVAEEIASHLAAGIPETQIYKTGQLPSEDAWRQYCKALVLQTRKKLEAWIDGQAANDPAMQGVSVRDVGCTLIWLVYTPMGLLTGHVGDGRAGYLDADGWQAMMTPWEGEYSNQTVFINSDFIYADQLENPLDPAKPYLETRVIVSQTVSAFVLMSDGCEHGLYETVSYDPVTNSNININKPHAGVCDNIIQLLGEPVGRAELGAAEQLFADIVDHGNSALGMESDDKTLILGFLSANKDVRV